MKNNQIGLKQIIAVVAIFAVASFLWQKVLGPSKQDRLEQTFVHAVTQRNVKGAEEAIAKGAEINPFGLSPLVIAVRNKDMPMVDMLLTKGAFPLLAKDSVLASEDETLLNRFLKHGLIIDWNDAVRALKAGEYSKLTFIVTNIDPDKLTSSNTNSVGTVGGDERPSNALSPRDQFLCETVVLPPERCIPILELILKRSPEPSTKALETADLRAKPEVIEYLVSHGFRYGLPEMIALGKIEEVREAIQKDPESIRRMEIQGPGTRPIPVLAISLQRGSHDISQLLIDADAKLDSYGNDQDILLWLAVTQPNVSILSRLLERSQGWYDPKRYDGDSPLQHLLRHSEGQQECVRLFLRHGLTSPNDGPRELKYALDGLGRCNAQQFPRQIEIVRDLIEARDPTLESFKANPMIDKQLQALGYRDLQQLLNQNSEKPHAP